jgi:hypothetical protein
MSTIKDLIRENFLEEALKQHDVDVTITHSNSPSKDIDAVIKINNQTIFIEYKRQVQPQNVMMIEEDLKKYARNAEIMVIANYITPKAKELLKKRHINYLDGAGNIYLKLRNLLVQVEGNKSQSPSADARYKNRAFTKSGAAVIFQFLMDPELVNAPQRTISEYANISLGTIPKVLSGLEQDGYLIKLNNTTRKLIDVEKLLQKWIEVINKKVLPAHLIGNFSYSKGDEHEFFRSSVFREDIQWGGEPAAAILTDYLRPEDYTIFTTLKRKELLMNYRLMPDQNGPLKIYTKFWNRCNANENTVHPILVYAQLIASGDSRNIETAEIIFNEHIKPNL